LYALGATLLHCLTGVAPAELLRPDLTLDTSRAGELRPWLDKLVALRREDRYASAEAALAALDAPPPSPVRRRSRWREWLARWTRPHARVWPELVRMPLPPRDRVEL